MTDTITNILEEQDSIKQKIDNALIQAASDGLLPGGYISPYAYNQNATPEELYMNCGHVSEKLQVILENYGDISTSLASSPSDNAMHVYLVIENSDPEIIIDGTIGQLLIGYNQIFVGTRQQLKELFFTHTGPLASYQFSEKWRWFKDPWTTQEQLFWWENIWGDTTWKIKR